MEALQPRVATRAFWIALTAFVWLGATAFYWVGYAGADDLFYARYAYLLHRPPTIWWEFRTAAILAIRGSFLIFGPTEFAAAVPSLLASLAILGSVAWFVGWPRTITWPSQSAMLLVAVIPIEVGFRSYPSANQISTGLLALGTVCVLKGARPTQHVGSALLALAFMAHEISFFYVALLCLTLLAFDWRRFWRPVASCIVFAAGLFVVEAVAYDRIVGDPLARWKNAAAPAAQAEAGVDAASGLQGLRIFTWPIETLIFGKHFGFNLAALLLTGAPAWRRLDPEQRMLLTATIAVFAWLAYGSMAPWGYKPLYRQVHYYNCLTFGVAALLPYTVALAFARRERLSKAIIGTAVVVHLLSLAATGRWGADVDVSRELLRYAHRNPDRRFVTDVSTMNHMYVLGGFRLPENVVCLNGPAVEQHLLLNKEPPGTPAFRFAEGPVHAVLVNLEQEEVRGMEPELAEYLRSHGGARATVAPMRYRLLFVPLLPLVGSHPFMIRSAGGEVVAITSATVRLPRR